MGYGPIVNGKQLPITPWVGSWAHQEQARREAAAAAPVMHHAVDCAWRRFPHRFPSRPACTCTPRPL